MDKFNLFEKSLIKTIKEFKDKKYFGFIGLAGSLKLENDLDLIITPINQVKRGKFLIVLLNFLKRLKEELNNNKFDLIVFNHFYSQEEVEYISKRNAKDIFIHLIGFSQFTLGKKDKVMKGFLNNIKKIYFGDVKYLKKIKPKKLDFYYGQLYFANLFYSRYPKNLLKKKINKKINYILKHTETKLKLTKNPLKDYIICCKALDKISNN